MVKKQFEKNEEKEYLLNFPDLERSHRDIEFKKYNKLQISNTLFEYLATGLSFRELDQRVLGLDAKKTKGFQSFGVLRYLGLVDRHKGYFKDKDISFIEDVLIAKGLLDVLDYFQISYIEKISRVTSLQTAIVDKEGGKIKYYAEKYERKPKLRNEAIRIHGITCKCCNFNFFKKYGDIGEGFIEIHHLKPLSSLNEEMNVNPQYDLVPVCSNCHRMLHRKRNEVVQVEDLILMMEERKKNE